MWKTLTIVVGMATPAMALACPEVPDHGAEIDALYAQMRIAGNESEAREYSNALWGYWLDSPDDAAQDLLDKGMEQRALYDLLGSAETLDRLVDYCPHYSEGWNQRAFTRYLGGQFEMALDDLDRALEIRPRHLGALTGKALTLIAMERKAEAIVVLREALDLNPWLGERHMLPALEQGEQDI